MIEKRNWTHKITGGWTAVVLSLILLALSGGVALALRASGNGAFIPVGFFAAAMGLVTLLCLYRALFFKVLLDRDGFFYQTAPGNGRYYSYYDLRRAWVSSGKGADAQQAQYCCFETRDGTVVRFFFRNPDWDAVDYLTDHVKSTEGQAQKSGGDFMISGRVQGGSRLAAAVCIFAAVLLVSIFLRTQGLSPVVYAPPVVLAAVALLELVCHNLFYKILIQGDGFYCRTNPFDGKYYKYSEVSDCRLTEVRQRRGSIRSGTRRTVYSYYFIFTDSTGKKRKILYDKALFQREMEVLAERCGRA